MKKYSMCLWIFIIGSFLGFIWENIWTVLKRGYFALRQGLIYEPLIPIYGVGALVLYLVYKWLDKKIDNKVIKVCLAFGIGFLLGGLIEYVFSYLQEFLLGTISWTYQRFKWNLNGRTSFIHAAFWGVLGSLFYLLVMPLFDKMIKYFDNKKVRFLTSVLSVILLLDIGISFAASIRQRERREGILPNNDIQELLDKYYDDERLGKVFTNAMPVER